jgi:acetyl esterase/lipase
MTKPQDGQREGEVQFNIHQQSTNDMTSPTPPRLTLLTFCLVFAVASPGFPAAPKPVPTKADIPYGSHPHQLLDVYVPPQGKGPFPVVIWYGSLWAPSKGAPTYAFLPAHCAAIAVEMRTMGDAIKEKISPPISVCLLDARRAVQFVRLHAAEWNLDPNRIAVGGGSQAGLPPSLSGGTASPTSAQMNSIGGVVCLTILFIIIWLQPPLRASADCATCL